MDRVKKLKVKKTDGSFTDYIPIGADAEYVDLSDGDNVENAITRIKSGYAHYYDNIKAMKADTKLKEGDTAVTLGYYKINDGGNGIYKIVNTDAIVDDGIIHNLNNGLKAELIIENTNELNILQVGGKADGITDIGDLINKYTTNYDIFLPAGIYNVTTNIELKNSLRGVGYARSGNKNKQYTWINDNVDSGILILISQNSNANILNVNNIAIDCNNCSHAIQYNPTKGFCYIDHIFIKNLSNTGIACEHDYKSVSRGCYVDTVCIFGKAYAKSMGINNAGPDNYFTNIEIMGTQIGIRSFSDLRLSDAHIWCGSMSGHDKDNWWESTRGIICFSDAIINNLYLDTCYCPILSQVFNSATNNWANHTILINNFKYWMDNSVEESLANNGTLALCWPIDDSKGYLDYHGSIVINNGYIYSKGRIKNVGSGRFNNITWMVNDINEIKHYNRLFGEEKTRYSLQYRNVKGKYNLIGIIQYNNPETSNQVYGIMEFKYVMGLNGGQNGQITIYRTYSHTEPQITNINYYDKTEQLYYKKDDKFIYIYALCTTNKVDYSITAENRGQLSGICALDLSRIKIKNKDTGDVSFIKESLDSSEELIRIPNGEQLDKNLV